MRSNQFVEAVAKAIDKSHDIVLADGEFPVTLQWGISTQPDTIVVETSDGDLFQIKVERLVVDVSGPGL
jgi:hypothetical protein